MATGRHINFIDFGRYVVTSTAGTLFSFATGDAPTSMPTSAQSFKGRIETASLRIRGDGVNPSSAVGELLDVGEDILLDDSMIAKVVLVRDGGTDAVINGHFYNVEASVLMGGG